MSSKPSIAARKNMTVCPKCGRAVLSRRLAFHTDGPECLSVQNLKAARAEGLAVPGDRGAAVPTVQMLARHAGIELERRHVRYNRVEKKTNAIFVAPVWLCKLACILNNQPRESWGARRAVPVGLLARLRDAATDERLREALMVQTEIRSKVK